MSIDQLCGEAFGSPEKPSSGATISKGNAAQVMVLFEVWVVSALVSLGGRLDAIAFDCGGSGEAGLNDQYDGKVWL